ncbi:MAG: UPF0104 family protein [Cyanobacteria bacterium P01_F01_bin.86]
MSIKSLIKRFKPYLRWGVLALTLAFLFHSLRQNWQQVLTLRFSAHAIALLMMATGVTLLAHIWSGWVWYWVMQLLDAPVTATWSVITYLKTNIAKYLPGNVWHFVGRVQSLKAIGTTTGVAITGVVLEPLLMAAAALAWIVVSQPSAWLQGGILLGVLAGIHPRVLNPLLKRLTTAKLRQTELTAEAANLGLRHYPLKPLLGEGVFVLGRGIGFLLAFLTLAPISLQDGWFIIGNFSLAWLLGLVLPGAPGGLGVFEATTLALLSPRFSAAAVLGAVALYRLISTIAEALAAGLAVIDEQWNLALAPMKALPSARNTRDSDPVDRQATDH